MTNKEISKLIFENNSQFYKLYCKINSCNYKKLDFCNSISNTNAGWPNFVFDINPSINQNDIDTLLTGIEKKELSDILLAYNSFFQNDEILVKNGFKKVAIWNAMALNLENTEIKKINYKLNIKIVKTESEIFDWIDIVKRELKIKFSFNEIINIIKNDDIKLYLGYYNSKAVSTALTFSYKNTVGHFMVSTLKEYIKKGFGKEMMQYSLKLAKKSNTKFAVLASTQQGFKLYKNIGYKEYDFYNLYWKLPL